MVRSSDGFDVSIYRQSVDSATAVLVDTVTATAEGGYAYFRAIVPGLKKNAALIARTEATDDALPGSASVDVKVSAKMWLSGSVPARRPRQAGRRQRHGQSCSGGRSGRWADYKTVKVKSGEGYTSLPKGTHTLRVKFSGSTSVRRGDLAHVHDHGEVRPAQPGGAAKRKDRRASHRTRRARTTMTGRQDEAAATGGREVAPYGSWRSPVTAKLIAEGGVSTMWPQSVGESLYWTELRPLEDGRYVVVRRAPDGEIADVTPAGRAAPGRSSTSTAAACTSPSGRRTAARASSSATRPTSACTGRTWRQRTGAASPAGDGAPRWSAPRPVTPAPPAARAHRYADGRVTPDGRLLVSVRERHEADGEVVNELVSLPTDGSARAARHRLRPRLLRRAPAQPGRAASRLARLGPPAHAVGRHGAVDGGARRRRQRHRRAPRRRRPRRGHPAAALEPGR